MVDTRPDGGAVLDGGAEVQLAVDHLFDLVPSAISVQGRDYRILRVNKTFRRLFGDRVGDYCFAAYKGRPEVCQDCPMARTFKDAGTHQSEEIVRTASGEILQVAVQTAPVLDEGGRVVGGMEVMTDISRTVAEQQELVLLGQAMAGMAHYIKNLLMGLDGGLFVVEEAMESGDQALLRDGWEMIRRNVGRVVKLSRDQLYCARERTPEITEVEVNQLVCEAVELYRERALADGVEIISTVDPRLGTGWLDAEGVHRLVTNLLSNALDACRFDAEKDRHWVSVNTFLEPGGQLHLEVADNGPGIPSRLCGAVFEEMFTTKGSGGTGLGLLVVYRVVCAHGGQISVLSEEGVGTVFTVILPLAGSRSQ